MRMIFLIGLLFSLASYGQENRIKQGKRQCELTDNIKIHTVYQEINNENLPAQFTLSYPQVIEKNLSRHALKFNNLMKEMVQKSILEFEKKVIANKQFTELLPEELHENKLFLDYDINVIRPKASPILSVRLTIEAHLANNASSHYSFKTLNFNYNKGKELNLNEFFKPDSDYLKEISAYSAGILYKDLANTRMIKLGTQPIIENFENWNLEKDGILFSFPEHQVAPYAYGIRKVKIPYENLKSVLSTNAIIYPCLENSKQCEAI